MITEQVWCKQLNKLSRDSQGLIGQTPGKAWVTWYQNFLERREELCLGKRNLA